MFRIGFLRLLSIQKKNLNTSAKFFQNFYNNAAENDFTTSELKTLEIPEIVAQWAGRDCDYCDEPIIIQRRYPDEIQFYIEPRQAWIENLDTIKEKKLGLISLHPEIFGAQPRTEIIHENIRWQRLYRWVASFLFN